MIISFPPHLLSCTRSDASACFADLERIAGHDVKLIDALAEALVDVWERLGLPLRSRAVRQSDCHHSAGSAAALIFTLRT